MPTFARVKICSTWHGPQSNFSIQILVFQFRFLERPQTSRCPENFSRWRQENLAGEGRTDHGEILLHDRVNLSTFVCNVGCSHSKRSTLEPFMWRKRKTVLVRLRTALREARAVAKSTMPGVSQVEDVRESNMEFVHIPHNPSNKYGLNPIAKRLVKKYGLLCVVQAVCQAQKDRPKKKRIP